MIDVINNIVDFQKIRDSWNQLYEEDMYCTPFQSFDYNYISWTRFHHQSYSLFIIVYNNKQETTPCAIFPFCIDSKKCLRFINEDHSDFQSALIRESYKTDSKMYEEVFSLIIEQSSIHRICLNHIRHDDLLLPYFGHLSPYARLYGTESYSYLPIATNPAYNSFIESLRHLTAKERNRLKNIEKKAEGFSFRIISKDICDYPEHEVDGLVRQMIKNGIRSEKYFDEKLLGFIKDLYNAGLLKIGLMSSEKEICSASFFYQCQNGMSIQWIIVYSDKTYNLQAKLKIFDSIYQNGGGVINLGRGTYAYKLQHFRPVIQQLYCVDIPFRRKARMMLLFQSLKDIMKKIKYRFGTFFHM